MKRLIILLLFLYIPVEGKTYKDNITLDFPIKLLQCSAVTLINLDTALTYNAIWYYNARESNPLVALYIKSLPITIALDLAFNYIVLWGTAKLYKSNLKYGKALAYIIVIGINIIQVYTMYQHSLFLNKVR